METIPTPNAENEDFEHSGYPSIYIAVLLAMHVIVTSRKFLTMGQCMTGIVVWNVYSIVPIDKNTGIYEYETETNVLQLDFHSFFHAVFLAIIL